jgi:hypothetical protein
LGTDVELIFKPSLLENVFPIGIDKIENVLSIGWARFIFQTDKKGGGER